MDYLQKPRRRSGIIYGELGWAEYDLVDLSVQTSFGDLHSWPEFDRNNMFIDEIAEFFKCVKDKTTPSIPLVEGIKSVFLAEAILKSLGSKSEVEVVGYE